MGTIAAPLSEKLLRRPLSTTKNLLFARASRVTRPFSLRLSILPALPTWQLAILAIQHEPTTLLDYGAEGRLERHRANTGNDERRHYRRER